MKTKTKKQKQEIKNFLTNLENDNNLDFSFDNIDINQIKLHDAYRSLLELLEDQGIFTVEFFYYRRDAMEYLMDNDYSLELSIKLARDYGYELRDCDSSLLASLLASDKKRQSFTELKYQINNFFAKFK